eukprot:CAMPEP_0115357720 /NCGR_PEP_ID=MMETSP0270-20121206/100292_1 /TAXON_ID=71861 /ORGANISM="Scrippsiella trochoidea, Strain CCMP3099" /LENGTH=63 /DNA_ID=CAMNT_0002780183 /DNA_START=386 /DNA_END=578 /DNA_ORIENTATION=+
MAAIAAKALLRWRSLRESGAWEQNLKATFAASCSAAFLPGALSPWYGKPSIVTVDWNMVLPPI